ncbi:helix-turn-helix transcriptional regulator [Nocardiopsis terrae]|uniref:helix-turn-helix transcriptional regulator n=1 Tax=Streptomyces sp. NPDC057554 TaxID=3350538 RepID=UPI00369B3796
MATRRTNGSTVGDIRGLAGLRQEDLARRVGISRAYLSNIERGKKQPSLLTAARIATALGVRLEAITYPDRTPEEEVRDLVEVMRELVEVRGVA